MHVLLTTDTVGGVWTYTEELCAGLVERGHRVTLVSLGRQPDAGQRAWTQAMDSSRFTYIETEFRLEWMEDSGEDMARSTDFLLNLVQRMQPDVLHTSQFVYGVLSNTLPVVLTGHSDVLSWWQAVHGASVPETGHMRAYTAVVRAGLLSATRLIAPTAWMARELREQYGVDRHIEVIPNGRSPHLFHPDRHKTLQAVTAARAWDPGKNVALLEQVQVPFPLLVAGEAIAPSAQAAGERLSSAQRGGVTHLGKQAAAQLRELYARSALYISTSSYEPFGLSPLEAALSGCALVLSDLPTSREIWDSAALFYEPRDARGLESMLRWVADRPEETEDLAARALARARTRYTAARMVEHHQMLYASLL